MNEQKRSYRIRNWREYNAALVERGSLTVWFDEDHRKQWYAADRNGRRGAPRRYSDVAVQCGLVIREVFHLPLRATEGLMRSVIDLLGVELATPDYSTFSRRAAVLTVRIGRWAMRRPRHLVIDSTGLKVYGEGEWPVRQHGASQRRTWRKLHVAVDAESHEVIAAEVTAAFVGDAEVLPDLLGQLPAEEPLASVAADGAYDTQTCHEALLNRRVCALIPPRAGAVAWPPLPDGRIHPRTVMVEHIRQHGRKAWKIHSGYHRRSLAETAMFRLKILFGERLRNHRFDTQTTEAYVRLAAMNRMTRLGMPETVEIS
ncbi:MAG TPA: IS5 family transposase [Gallionella sp.]|nr:IS5 family transposase [Gallionella sp.]